MWKSFVKTRGMSEDLDGSMQEIFESGLRNIFKAFLALYAVWHFAATILWPESFSAKTWFLSVLVAILAYTVFRLLKTNLLSASLSFQAGFIFLVLLALVLYQAPVVLLFLGLIPLIAVTTTDWKVAAGATTIVWLIVLLVGNLSAEAQIPRSILWVTAFASIVTGVIGYSASSSMLLAAEWSALGFRQAREMTKVARQNQAHLAVVLRNLDQAYYRLERVNTELVVAKKKAEETEDFKTRLTAMVSHELRTPLNLIIGFSEVMITSPESYENITLPPVYRSDVNAIYQSARHILALVDDILDITRAEAGKITLNRRHEDLVDVVVEASGMVQEYISAKNLSYSLHVPEARFLVNIDRLRIRQVILNLLVNAIRFTQKGSITMRLVDRPNEVRVEVVDTGRGIPIEERSRIFTDFQSTETQTLNWHGSSGLGLSISKKFVELHQGCIGLESEVEQGSTFWFTLPKKNESHNCEKLRGVIREVPSELELSYKERILVAVCEDENTLTYLQRHLSGFKVLPATGIPEALHLLQEVRAMGILSTDPLPDIEIPDNVIYVQIPSSGIKEIARTFQVRDVLVKPVTRQGLLKGLLKLPEPASRILVADDDPDVARLYERMLVDYQGSREIIVAYNGIEALDAMRTYLPDLVLLDVAMPEMDGWEVLKQKALDLSIAHIPVIIISARFEEFLSARLAGVIGFTRRNGLQIGEVTTLVGDGLRSLAPEWFSVGDESGGGPESNDLG